MVRWTFSDYERAAALLLAMATLLLGIVVITNRGDLTSATLVLCGVGSFIAAIFILTFSKGEAIDPRVAGLLSAQGSITIATLCADLGIQGNGYVVPGVATGDSTLTHYIPVAEYRPLPRIADTSFLMEEDACGATMKPAGEPLRLLLGREYGLTIPTSEPDLLAVIKEVAIDVLELADDASVVRAGETVVVDLDTYRLVDGCRTVRAASPKCCSVYPCPFCSLIACILAQGSGRPVTLEQVAIDPRKSNLRLVYAFLP